MAAATKKKPSSTPDRPERASDDAHRDLLREAGLKVTHGRLAVLRELSKAKTPLSHGEVAERLAREELDRVTVWRILVALTEVGIVDRTDVGDHTWRFELRNTSMGHDPHPHFMCVSCNTVQCLPRDVVRLAPKISRGVVDVQIKGRCASCL